MRGQGAGSSGSRQVGMAMLGYLALALVCVGPALGVPGPSVPGAEQTDLFNGLWGSWFVRESVLAGGLPWDVSTLNFPHGGKLLVLDPMGSLFVSAISVFLGVGAAYNCLVVLRIAASGFVAHYFVRSWLVGECGAGLQAAGRAGWLAGVVYATAPVLLIGVHNGNPESFNGAWLVASVWASWLAARQGGLKWVALAGLGLLGASLANWYSGVCAFLFAGSFLLLGAGDGEWRKNLVSRVLSVGLGLVLVVPVAALVDRAHGNSRELSRVQSEQSIREIRRGEGAASAFGWVVQDPKTKPTGQPGRSVYQAAHGLGVVALMGAVFGVVRSRRKARVWVLGGTAGAVLAMGPAGELFGREIALPYALLEGVSGFDGLSLLWRLGQAPALSVAVLFAVGCWSLGRRGFQWIAVGLVMDLVLFSPVVGRIGGVSIEVPEAIAGLAGAPAGAVLTYPGGARERELLHQITHEHPLTRSLDILQNDTESSFWQAMADNPHDLDRFQDIGVRYLVVHDHVSARQDPHRALVQELEERLSPRFGEGTSSRVYALW